jgi:hypothetical protein
MAKEGHVDSSSSRKTTSPEIEVPDSTPFSISRLKDKRRSSTWA